MSTRLNFFRARLACRSAEFHEPVWHIASDSAVRESLSSAIRTASPPVRSEPSRAACGSACPSTSLLVHERHTLRRCLDRFDLPSFSMNSAATSSGPRRTRPRTRPASGRSPAIARRLRLAHHPVQARSPTVRPNQLSQEMPSFKPSYQPVLGLYAQRRYLLSSLNRCSCSRLALQVTRQTQPFRLTVHARTGA